MGVILITFMVLWGVVSAIKPPQSPHRQVNVRKAHTTETTYCYAELPDISLPLANHSDVGVSPAASVDDCAKRCAATLNCSAFTWTSVDATCMLKSSYGNGIVVPGAVSGLVDKSKGDRCHGIPFFVDNALLVGGDLPPTNTSTHASDVTGCFFLCAAVPPCDRFTWTQDGDGTCWLKDASSQGYVVVDGVHSGFILHPLVRTT